MNCFDVDKNDKDYTRLYNLHKKCFKDLTGKKFGMLTVLEFDYKRKQPNGKYAYYWKCKCDCGNVCSVIGGALTSNHTQSCGCKHRGSQLKDLTGKKFGNLLVLSYSRYDGKNHLWNCKCDCGNAIEAIGKSLTSGNRKSCGCAKRKIKPSMRRYDLANKKFGKLVAISPENHSFWKCKCDCGNEVLVKTADLLRGFTQSCGCVSNNHSSFQEIEVKEFVQSILPNEFIEKSKILGDDSVRKQEIDIYIPSMKIGIEYNGSAFHASENVRVGRGKDILYHQQKFLQAKKQGIHLISIFDIDWLENTDIVKKKLTSILLNNVKHEIPTEQIVYTNNDYDNGEWLRQYGYTEICQEEPSYYIYRDFKVYRSGTTKWGF